MGNKKQLNLIKTNDTKEVKLNTRHKRQNRKQLNRESLTEMTT